VGVIDLGAAPQLRTFTPFHRMMARRPGAEALLVDTPSVSNMPLSAQYVNPHKFLSTYRWTYDNLARFGSWPAFFLHSLKPQASCQGACLMRKGIAAALWHEMHSDPGRCDPSYMWRKASRLLIWLVGRMTLSNSPFPSKGDREEHFELIQVFCFFSSIPCRK
jgi:hypothetical protein